jgi:cytochrome c-type biogenesis protein CcmH/NrfF
VRARRLSVAALLAAALAGSAPALAATPRASLADLQSQVMCVVCKAPLEVSQGPQADAERAFISGLIARGETAAQIKRALVAQYGDAVLALPKAKGFDVTVYVVPAVAVALALVALAIALPRWRRRQAAPGIAEGTTAPLSPEDARRLDEDLARSEL